jgi:hypothetical protein
MQIGISAQLRLAEVIDARPQPPASLKTAILAIIATAG